MIPSSTRMAGKASITLLKQKSLHFSTSSVALGGTGKRFHKQFQRYRDSKVDKRYKDADIEMMVPDNAPTQDENTEWLNNLSRRSDTIIKETDGIQTEEGHQKTYEIKQASKLDSPDTNPDFQSFRYNKTYKNFVSKPLRGVDPFFRMSVPASEYFVASSPFSSNPSKSRPKAEKQTFADLRVVKLTSGSGGNGNVSFFRDAGVATGPPDGGDGGDGGNVYVTAVPELSSLHTMRSTYVAGNGGNGQSGQLDGKSGDDLYITVPVGTSIRWCPDPKDIRLMKNSSKIDKMRFHIKAIGERIRDKRPQFIQLFRNSFVPGTGWIFKEKSEEYHLEREYFNQLNEKVTLWDRQKSYDELMNDIFPIHGVDFPEPTKEPVLLLAGGKGGMGNMHFLTPNIRNPRFAKAGRQGLSSHFIFELRLLADLGLVGLPNAGKSTLLRAISNARPRVGHWEFTTLQPSIGTIPISNRIDLPPFTVADIPGIVKGASDNKGMGLNFLRHVERSGGLVFVISLGSENPVDDLNVLLEEMGEDRLHKKNILVVATKADLENSQQKFKELREYVTGRKWKIVPCCAMKKENIETVIQLMGECSGKIRPAGEECKEEDEFDDDDEDYY